MMNLQQAIVSSIARGSLGVLAGVSLGFFTLLAIEGWEAMKARGLLETGFAWAGLAVVQGVVQLSIALDLFGFVREWITRRKLAELDRTLDRHLELLERRVGQNQITKKRRDEVVDRLLRRWTQAACSLLSRGVLKTEEPLKSEADSSSKTKTKNEDEGGSETKKPIRNKLVATTKAQLED